MPPLLCGVFVAKAGDRAAAGAQAGLARVEGADRIHVGLHVAGDRHRRAEAAGARAAVDEATEQKLYVRVTNPDDHERLLALKKLFSKFDGTSEIILVLGKDKGSAMRLPFKVDPRPELLEAARELYGAEHVVLK